LKNFSQAGISGVNMRSSKLIRISLQNHDYDLWSPALFSPINWNYWNVHILSYLLRSISLPTKEGIWLMVWPHSMVWDGGLRLLRFPINQFQKAHIIRYLGLYADSIWSTNNIRSQYSLFRWERLWL